MTSLQGCEINKSMKNETIVKVYGPVNPGALSAFAPAMDGMAILSESLLGKKFGAPKKGTKRYKAALKAWRAISKEALKS